MSVGEEVRLYTEAAGEQIRGTLEGVTEHGIIVNTRGRDESGPSFYSWKTVHWIVPEERQTRRER